MESISALFDSTHRKIGELLSTGKEYDRREAESLVYDFHIQMIKKIDDIGVRQHLDICISSPELLYPSNKTIKDKLTPGMHVRVEIQRDVYKDVHQVSYMPLSFYTERLHCGYESVTCEGVVEKIDSACRYPGSTKNPQTRGYHTVRVINENNSPEQVHCTISKIKPCLKIKERRSKYIQSYLRNRPRIAGMLRVWLNLVRFKPDTRTFKKLKSDFYEKARNNSK